MFANINLSQCLSKNGVRIRRFEVAFHIYYRQPNENDRPTDRTNAWIIDVNYTLLGRNHSKRRSEAKEMVENLFSFHHTIVRKSQSTSDSLRVRECMLFHIHSFACVLFAHYSCAFGPFPSAPMHHRRWKGRAVSTHNEKLPVHILSFLHLLSSFLSVWKFWIAFSVFFARVFSERSHIRSQREQPMEKKIK